MSPSHPQAGSVAAPIVTPSERSAGSAAALRDNMAVLVPALKALYPDTFDTFMGSCGVKQFMKVQDPTTAEYVSALCGEREVVTVGRSVNTNPIYDYQDPTQEAMNKFGVSDSKNVATRRLILPHEVRSLGPREQILWLPGVNNPVRCNRKSYLEIPELTRLARSNPFYRKGA